MDIQRLRSHLKAKGWSQSELARRIGVSRQAVSLWLRGQGQVSVRSPHLFRVSEALGVPVSDLRRPLPGFGASHEPVRAALLWDQLYPDLDDFAIAVNRWEPRAVARLVQVHGLYAAEKVLGPEIWGRFPTYAPHIHPVRRRELEALVRWRESRTAS